MHVSIDIVLCSMDQVVIASLFFIPDVHGKRLQGIVQVSQNKELKGSRIPYGAICGYSFCLITSETGSAPAELKKYIYPICKEVSA